MKISDYFKGFQLRKPWGKSGDILFKKIENINRPVYKRCLELLKINNFDKILEIGYGTGVLINEIATKNDEILVYGTDFSHLMSKKAFLLNKEFIEKGKVFLYNKDINRISLNIKFNKIIALNVLYFWENIDFTFKRIYNLLEKDGEIIFYMNEPEQLNDFGLEKSIAFNKYKVDYIKERLSLNNFLKVRDIYFEMQGEKGYFIIAEK